MPGRSFRQDMKASLALAGMFVDRARTVATEHELHALMEDISKELGFRYFALIHHDDLRQPRRGLININNYPPVWADHFIEQQLYRKDPVVHACHYTNAGFCWSELSRFIYLNAERLDILEGGAREGLAQGITIPGGVTGERGGSCSFAGPRSDIVLKRHFLVAQLVGVFGFEAARRVANGRAGISPSKPVLSRRQRECTVLAGQGKKDLVIAHTLGLSYKTVVSYLDAARRRYGVRTREQLIICAVLDGDICLAELDTR